MTNLAEAILGAAGEHADRVAIRLDDRELSYAELNEASGRAAAMLAARGIEPGDRVGLMLPNVPEFPILYYGILRAGGVVVPMNVLLKRREIAYFLEDSGAKLLAGWHGFAEEARPGAKDAGAELLEVEPESLERELAGHEPASKPVAREPDDTAVILYTSGTTGKPKGAELTNANLATNAKIAGEHQTEVQPDDVVLGCLPLFHSFGQTVAMNASLRVGACLTMLARFEPGAALETMQRDRVTCFLGVPTMYGAILNHPGREDYDTSSLRNCVSGGASMPVELLRGFEGAFDCKILEGYGLSETSPVACGNPPDRERVPGSIGVPIRGVEMKVVGEDGAEVPPGEVGEIVIKGHNVMKGYWGKPEATAEAIRDGWFHSGDLAKVDENGYFFIVDRKKDLIIRGGYNIYPREVEEILYEHPAILEAAVVGAPHDELGEEVCAAVVLREGEELTAEEISAYVKGELAAYKYPRRVWFIDELPKGPTGKILKRELTPPEA